MAEPRWKTAAGARLVSAYGDCVRARHHPGMAAAELVPTDPVASVSRVRDADHGVWLALTRLRDAREHGRQALVPTEAAFGHLWAAQFIGARLPSAAGPDAVMEDHVRAAMDKIRAVLD